MTYIMSCVWLDYMVKYFQCKNCVGSSLKTKKCVASFLVPGDNPSVPMDTRIFYLAKSRYEHLNHDRQICFTGESEEGYLLSEKIRDKKIFTR